MSQGLVKFEGNARAELVQEAESANEFSGLVIDLSIETQEDLELASEALAKVKGEYKRLEERKKAVTGPLTTAINEVRSWFKPAQDYYSKAEVVLKKRIADYHTRLAEQNAQAMALAAAAAEQNDTTAVLTAIATIETAEKIKGLSIREAWDFEVVDVYQVPREYMFVNETAVKEHIKETTDKSGEPLPIPGIRFVKKQIVASRAK